MSFEFRFEIVRVSDVRTGQRIFIEIPHAFELRLSYFNKSLVIKISIGQTTRSAFNGKSPYRAFE